MGHAQPQVVNFSTPLRDSALRCVLSDKMSFIKLRNGPFIDLFLKMFIMNGCWIFVECIVLLVSVLGVG